MKVTLRPFSPQDIWNMVQAHEGKPPTLMPKPEDLKPLSPEQLARPFLSVLPRKPRKAKP